MLDPRTGNFVITSAIDNLVKGASGQAVQIMNLWFGFPETAGLSDELSGGLASARTLVASRLRRRLWPWRRASVPWRILPAP